MSLESFKQSLVHKDAWDSYLNTTDFQQVYKDIMAFRNEANDLFEMTKAVVISSTKPPNTSRIDYAHEIILFAEIVISKLNEL